MMSISRSPGVFLSRIRSEPQARRSRILVRATDRDIGLVREQLNTLKTLKKGLMQKLLTGQVRVKLPEGANDG
jgi:hypothetical protein